MFQQQHFEEEHRRDQRINVTFLTQKASMRYRDAPIQVCDVTTGKLVWKIMNSPENMHGQRIKVLIVDGSYSEGVNISDVGFQYTLDPMASRAEAEQGAARSTRFCQSTNLPFLAGVGSLTEYIYFRGIIHGQNKSLYEMALDCMPQRDFVESNAVVLFSRLLAQIAVDRRYNFAINEFNPRYPGIIRGYDMRFKGVMLYKIAIMVNARDQGREITNMVKEFLVDTPNVFGYDEKHTGQGLPEQTVVSDALNGYAEVKILKYDDDKRRYWVEAKGSQPYWLDQAYAVLPVSNRKVWFSIPYGVDLVVKVLNIANYQGSVAARWSDALMPVLTSPMGPKASSLAQISAPGLPDQVLKASWRGGHPAQVMMGLITVMRLMRLYDHRYPLHLVLPSPKQYQLRPSVDYFSLQWRCDERSGKHRMEDRSESHMLDRFLKPKTGLSFMTLHLVDRECRPQTRILVHKDHMNLLIYCPRTKTVERFDPYGRIRTGSWFDQTGLDETLQKEFQRRDPSIQYMVSREHPIAEINNVFLQQSFMLVYLHARIIYDASMTGSESGPERYMYPQQFQQALYRVIQQDYQVPLAQYLEAYASFTAQTELAVKQWTGYRREDMLFTNCIRYAHAMMGNLLPPELPMSPVLPAAPPPGPTMSQALSPMPENQGWWGTLGQVVNAVRAAGQV